MDESQILDVALLAARAATSRLLHHLGSAKVQFKGDITQDLVTEADVDAEATVLRVINDAFPDHDVLGEEGLGAGDLSAENLWVIDPLDGTTNYAQGIPHFCTAISYVCGGEVQVGVVHDPMRDELFQAVRGQGAFLNGEAIHVSRRNEMNSAVIATGFYYDRGEMMRRTLASIDALFQQNVRGIRRLGSAALDQCWVACGRMDGFFEYQLSPWDYAAASLIVEEAGGRCADRNGDPLRLESGNLIVSNQLLFDDILAAVRW